MVPADQALRYRDRWGASTVYAGAGATLASGGLVKTCPSLPSPAPASPVHRPSVRRERATTIAHRRAFRFSQHAHQRHLKSIQPSPEENDVSHSASQKLPDILEGRVSRAACRPSAAVADL